MRVCLLWFLLACVARAQPSSVLDDLERRASEALAGIPHATTSAEAEGQREKLRQRLEQSLQLDRGGRAGRATTSIDLPDRHGHPSAAILILHSHDDPQASQARTFAASAARLGFVVMTLDVREDHPALDRLFEGATPQGITQAAVRRALAYLASRPDVDPRRIGLIGTGLPTTVAAAINPQLRVAVVMDGFPDFHSELGRLRQSGGNQAPDGCLLIPGMLRYAATQELLAMIAPRPLLAFNAPRAMVEYASDLYRSLGSLASISTVPAAETARETRYAAYRWFARWLQDLPELPEFSESETAAAPLDVRLPDSPPAGPAPAVRFSRAVLDRLLGTALPASPISYVVQPTPVQQIKVEPQPGIHLPLTVFRPGPEGADPGVGHLVALDDSGRQALEDSPVVREALRRKWVVWAIDPRGIGEMKSGRDGFVFAASLLLGENFVWRGAADVARLAGSLAQGTMAHRVAIYARGPHAGLIAAYSGAMGEGSDLAWIALEDPAPSFLKGGKVPLYWPALGAAGVFDIADLIAAAKVRVLAISSPDELIQTDW